MPACGRPSGEPRRYFECYGGATSLTSEETGNFSAESGRGIERCVKTPATLAVNRQLGEALVDGVRRRLGAVANADLAVHMRDVSLNRPQTQEELRRDL